MYKSKDEKRELSFESKINIEKNMFKINKFPYYDRRLKKENHSFALNHNNAYDFVIYEPSRWTKQHVYVIQFLLWHWHIKREHWCDWTPNTNIRQPGNLYAVFHLGIVLDSIMFSHNRKIITFFCENKSFHWGISLFHNRLSPGARISENGNRKLVLLKNAHNLHTFLRYWRNTSVNFIRNETRSKIIK